MAEHREYRMQYGLPQYGQYQYGKYQQQRQQPRSHQVAKAAAAVTAGGTLLALSGLTLAVTVIGLTVSTPVLVICSPVLVPAAITVFLLMAGFVTSGGLGVAALSVLSWTYKYLRGKQPPGAEQLDHASYKLVVKARDMRDRAEQFGQQHLPGGGGGGAAQAS